MEIKIVNYQADISMEGYIAQKDRTSKPLVLVVHDWSGCRDFAKQKAEYFAKLGCLGFAIDLYGKGKRGSDTDTSLNQSLLNDVMQNREVIVTRLQSALDYAIDSLNADKNKVIAVGFCFGGLCVLDFARAGASVNGVVSVHGLLFPPENYKAKKVTSRILALHGYNDKMATPEQLAGFQEEMTGLQANWQTHVYGNTWHAFTNPKANNDELGLKYSQEAENRAWDAVENFMQECFS